MPATAQEPESTEAFEFSPTLELHEHWAEGFRELFPESLQTTRFYYRLSMD